ncbi:MAG: glycosyltransferase [Candidatus Helarchaeota archaeon]|nr:glycosyltransferase [Candidatus Helarchaeota archaeon]
MKKVLILAYYYPPLGMGGVQRATKFAKYLPVWKPIVISVKGVEYYSYDESLLKDISNIKIVRTGSLDPLRIAFIFRRIFRRKKNIVNRIYREGRLKRFYNTISRWIFIPDSKLLWIPFAVLKSLKIIKKENISIIFTTSPPNSSHIAGLFLKWLSKVKWVADFRDYWSPDRVINFPTPFHKFFNDFIKRKIIKNADHIIGVSLGIIDEAKGYYKKDDSDYSVIMNGFDADDFPENITKKRDNKFYIIHSGTFNYLRNPGNFLSGLELAVIENPDLRNDALFLHIGISIDFDLKSEAEKRGIDDIIVEKGYINHKECIKLLLNGNLLLLVQSDFCSSGMIPAKIFEYLASNIPILAVVPDGEAADLIRRFNRGTICENKNIEKVKNSVLFYYNEWKKNKPEKTLETPLKIPEELKKYSRKSLANDLKNIFDKIVK